jgi:hypothetical protein
MDTMTQGRVDLAGIFQSVTQALAENQQSLNQADEFNQDHGNNMVQTFQTITQALQQKRGSSDSEALSYAAKKLAGQTTSGSGQLYAQNLAQAANLFQGKQIDLQGAIALLQTLIGGGNAAAPAGQPTSGDMIGALLGSLTGGGGTTGQQQSPASGDLLGSLLGGLTGGGTTQSQQPAQAGGDLLGSILGSLMGAGGEQGGQTGGQADQQPSPPAGGDLLGTILGGLTSGGGLGNLAQAFLNGSNLGNTTHRNQSTQLVVDSFLKSLGSTNG